MIDVLKPQLPLWLHARLLAVLVQCPDSQSEAPGLCWQVQPALKSLYFQDGWSQVYNKTLTSTCPHPPHLKWPVCWSLHFRCQKSLLTPCDLPIAYPTCQTAALLAGVVEFIFSNIWSPHEAVRCHGSSPELRFYRCLRSWKHSCCARTLDLCAWKHTRRIFLLE